MHWLTDCALLSEIFATKIVKQEQNGQCQRRLVHMRGHEFIEEIIQLSETKLVYQIVGEGPVKNHRGQIEYITYKGGHYLQYQIHGQSNTWVPTWLLRIVMYCDFTLASKRLRAYLSEC